MSRCWPRSQQQTRTHRLHRRWKFRAASGWGSHRPLCCPGQLSTPGILACLTSLQMPSTPHPLCPSLRASTSLWGALVQVRRGAHSPGQPKQLPCAPLPGQVMSNGYKTETALGGSPAQPLSLTPMCFFLPTPPHNLQTQRATLQGDVFWAQVSSATTLCFNACSALCTFITLFLIIFYCSCGHGLGPGLTDSSSSQAVGQRKSGGEMKCLLHFKTLSGNFTHTLIHKPILLPSHWPEFNYKASGYLPGNLENTVYSRMPSTWIKWEFQVWGLPICATLIIVWRNKCTCDSFCLEDWTSGMKTKRIKMAVGEYALVRI